MYQIAKDRPDGLRQHISVLIPAYNVERFLGECLNSLSRQTCDDFNVVIVDDGSIDGTALICDAYCSENAHAAVVHTENRGLLLARRAALAKAVGTHVMFLDADDEIRPDTIEKCYGYIRDFDPDILMFRSCRNAKFDEPVRFIGPAAGFYDTQGALKSMFLEGNMNSMWGKVFKKNIVEIDKDYSDFAGLMHGEDLLQLAGIVEGSQNMLVVDDVLYHYRKNDGASTSRYKTSQRKDLIRVLGEMVRYSRSWHLENQVMRCVARNVVFLLTLLFSDKSIENATVAKELQALSEFVASISSGFKKNDGLNRLRLDYELILDSLLRGNYGCTKALVLLRNTLTSARNDG